MYITVAMCCILQYQKSEEISITVDHAQKVLLIGYSKDYGMCKANTKAGRSCSNFINK